MKIVLIKNTYEKYTFNYKILMKCVLKNMNKKHIYKNTY